MRELLRGIVYLHLNAVRADSWDQDREMFFKIFIQVFLKYRRFPKCPVTSFPVRQEIELSVNNERLHQISGHSSGRSLPRHSR